MLAAMVLGADGVQVAGLLLPESSAHTNFKDTILAVKEGGTQLTLKELAPVINQNKFLR
jgi:enoyl-[acyl-carrier protein] reductase II